MASTGGRAAGEAPRRRPTLDLTHLSRGACAPPARRGAGSRSTPPRGSLCPARPDCHACATYMCLVRLARSAATLAAKAASSSRPSPAVSLSVKRSSPLPPSSSDHVPGAPARAVVSRGIGCGLPTTDRSRRDPALVPSWRRPHFRSHLFRTAARVFPGLQSTGRRPVRHEQDGPILRSRLVTLRGSRSIRRTLRKNTRRARDAHLAASRTLINFGLWIEQNGSSPGRAPSTLVVDYL